MAQSWMRLYESSIYAKLAGNYGIGNEATFEWLILWTLTSFFLLIDKYKGEKSELMRL